jgi:uncharacterized protein YxeA
MKKITTFLALLLTCIIGATAADFVPKDGTKYLIKCKGDNNVVCTREGTIILQAQQEVTDASYFTIESTVVKNVTYFYIHPAGNTAKYVCTTQTPSTNNDANNGVVGVTDAKDDATCLWKIAFNTNTSAFNITPKGYDEYSWNCRDKGIGYWTTRYKNNEDNNSWYITPNVVLNGYYTIKNTATDRRTNLYNDFSVDNITRAAENLPTTLTNNYVWHVTTANNNVLTVLNGQGTPLYHDGNGNASLPTLKVAYSDGAKYYFGEALNCGNSGRNFKLTLWKDGDYSVADNQWTFAPVEVSNIYNVVCNIADGYVTYNSTSEKAKNGGFFFLSSAPQVADLTAATVEYYDAAVTVDGNNINVTYTCRLEELKQDAKKALAKTGVGYPTATAATRTALANVVEGTDAAAIATALEAYKNDKTSIQMPEDGKAYVITNIHKTGGKRYMKYTAEGTSMIARDDATVLPIEATYICHKVNDKYVFANNSGTYLTWRGSATGDCTNGNKGYTASYNADYNTFTVAANPNVFGCLSFGAKRDHDTYTQSYYIITATGSFQEAGFNDYYDENNSSAFTFEEVTYPNTITFHDAQNINGVSHIATFSAPFATIIPTGVKAYYVSAKGAEATMTAIDAQAIPANQGVILTSESGYAATMVPAAGETAATITGNQLGNSAGNTRSLTAGEGYILGNGTEGTAFYPCQAGSLPINKAYLLGNGESSAIVMNFGNAVTGINTIAAPASAKAPIFDLSGRRVVKATKGLYIQNGKKVIVK